MLKAVIAFLVLFFPIIYWPLLQPDNVITRQTILYDARLGSPPDEQGLSLLALSSSVTQTTTEPGTVLDTTGDIGDQAGYLARESLSLDRHLGYKLRFDVQIQEEAHQSPNRAGFSVTVVSNDYIGLELAFWENEIWVQSGGAAEALFTHAEGVIFETGDAIVSYELRIDGDSYVLSANDNTLLSGSLRDYTAFDGFPDPYEVPGFLFLGDNTGRGAAETVISYVAVETNYQPTATPPVTDTVTPDPTATPTALPTPTSTATATLQPTETVSATTAPPTAAAPAVERTPRSTYPIYLWMSCLKGVDIQE